MCIYCLCATATSYWCIGLEVCVDPIHKRFFAPLGSCMMRWARRRTLGRTLLSSGWLWTVVKCCWTPVRHLWDKVWLFHSPEKGKYRLYLKWVIKVSKMALLKGRTDHDFLLETIDVMIETKLKEKQKYALWKPAADRFCYPPRQVQHSLYTI